MLLRLRVLCVHSWHYLEDCKLTPASSFCLVREEQQEIRMYCRAERERYSKTKHSLLGWDFLKTNFVALYKGTLLFHSTHNIIKYCAVRSCGPREYNHGDAATLSGFKLNLHYLQHPHAYILMAHMNKQMHNI